MVRYLILPLIVLLVFAAYNILKQLPASLKINREKRRREAEHRDYMNAYNTRRQLYGEVYSTSRRYNLVGNEDAHSQGNLSGCYEDDEVEIEYDDGKRKYAVSCNGGKIGYLPPGAGDVLGKISDYKAIVSAMGFTNADKYYAQITVFSNE